MAFVSTSNIEVFPSTKRGLIKPEARAFTEKNVSRLVNKLTDKDSYIISYENNILEFSIHGYYFKVTNVENQLLTPLNNQSKIVAWIRLTKTTIASTDEYVELYGQDDDRGYYEGIEFTGDLHSVEESDQLTNEGYYSLELFNKVGDGWQIITDNFAKFDSSSFTIDEIDGGTLG